MIVQITFHLRPLLKTVALVLPFVPDGYILQDVVDSSGSILIHIYNAFSSVFPPSETKTTIQLQNRLHRENGETHKT